MMTELGKLNLGFAEIMSNQPLSPGVLDPGINVEPHIE